jgi:2-polyprenyl-3-methyl-5-hydroxy-6-metoxy-1,4-benzoquinol methylase
MKTAQEVSVLFDTKSQTWADKYAAHGPLAHRVTVFSTLLRSRVAAGASVLDFGGGTGAIASALVDQGFRMSVCDVSEGMITTGKKSHEGRGIDWTLLPRDWKRLPWADATYDAMIASSVFEYLDDVDGVLVECARILRPGAALIFSVPDPRDGTRKIERCLRPMAVALVSVPGVRSLPKVGGYLSYLRVSSARYSADEWRERAGRAGFEPVDIGSKVTDTDGNKGMMYLMFSRAGAR